MKNRLLKRGLILALLGVSLFSGVAFNPALSNKAHAEGHTYRDLGYFQIIPPGYITSTDPDDWFDRNDWRSVDRYLTSSAIYRASDLRKRLGSDAILQEAKRLAKSPKLVEAEKKWKAERDAKEQEAIRRRQAQAEAAQKQAQLQAAQKQAQLQAAKKQAKNQLKATAKAVAKEQPKEQPTQTDKTNTDTKDKEKKEAEAKAKAKAKAKMKKAKTNPKKDAKRIELEKKKQYAKKHPVLSFFSNIGEKIADFFKNIFSF